MKKFSLLFLVAILGVFISCQKESVVNSGNGLATAPANTASTVNVTPGSSGDILNEPFNGNFSIVVPDPNNVFEKQPVKLLCKSMDVVSYNWKINDMKITERNPTIYFGWHGNYHITLTVTDKDGNTASSSKDLTILCTFMHNVPY